MPLRDLTPEELGQIQPLRDMTRDERAQFARQQPVQTRIKQRIFGEDVEDPNRFRLAPVAAGAITGAMAGSKVPIAPGPLGLVVNPITGTLVLGAAGAAGGAVAPEFTMEAGEFLGLLPKGTRERFGLSNEELRTVMENEALVEFALGSAFTGAGLVRRGAARVMNLAGKESTQLADIAKTQGIDLPGFMAGGSIFSRSFTAVFGRFPLLGSALRKTGEAASKQIEPLLQGLPERVAPVFSSSTVGRRLLRNAKTTVRIVGKKFDEQYTKLWADAEAADVKTIPRNAALKAGEITQRILKSSARTLEGERLAPSPGSQAVLTFLGENISPLVNRTEGVTEFSRMTLKQADGLVSKIDEAIAALEPSQKKFGASQLLQLKAALQKDVYENLAGPGAQEIAGRLRALDSDFSTTMRTLFETATAQKFARVERRGLRGMSRMEATSTPADRLADIILDLRAPQVVDEMSRIVSNRGMREITSNTLDRILDKGWKSGPNGTHIFDPNPVMKELGIGSRTSDKFKTISSLLSKSGGLSIKEVESVLKSAKAISETEIPNMSTFIARRVTIGGMRAAHPSRLLNLTGDVTGMILTLTGIRGLGKMLADPLAARSFRKVLSPTVARSQRRASAIRLGRMAVDLAGEDNVNMGLQTAVAAKTMVVKAVADMFGTEK